MSSLTPFARKIVYLCGIVVLLSSLAWISPPATLSAANEGGSPGGRLAQLRSEYGLSQANLGEIDPTSEAIKLATLGMRGVAANLLWTKANHYFLTKDWNSFSATVQQIIKLQPNFVGVWRYQGWVQAYNVSVEWDDYHDRYFWVIKGVNFLKEGTRYNETEPILLWDVGWFEGHKIGRADERKQFRKLFREDDVFHGDRPVAMRDNWLVGKEAFLEARDLIENKGAILRQMTPILFYANIPLWQVNYASALEDEGTFGEVASLAWAKGADEWKQLGGKDLVTTADNETLRLDDFSLLAEKRKRILEVVAQLAPDTTLKLRAERREALTAEERALLEKPELERTTEENGLIQEINQRLDVSVYDVAKAEQGKPNGEKLTTLSKQLTHLDRQMNSLGNWHNNTRYADWTIRCMAERTDNAIEARRLAFEAERLFREEAELISARDHYAQSLEKWRAVLDEYPSLKIDTTVGEDLCNLTFHYQDCLRQLDEALPKPYILQDVLDANQQYVNLPR